MNEAQVRGIVKGIWDETPMQFGRVRLDSYVVMPNHMHGVVSITSGGRGNASPLPVTTPLVSRIQPHAPVAVASRDGAIRMLSVAWFCVAGCPHV